ncbi:hypothetical protein BT69DRAFT_681272 [Atractiella rhizophila]|nr:hypothetical protein BT69DRAFT_681272 [Atractiella rhizophila]
MPKVVRTKISRTHASAPSKRKFVTKEIVEGDTVEYIAPGSGMDLTEEELFKAASSKPSSSAFTAPATTEKKLSKITKKQERIATFQSLVDATNPSGQPYSKSHIRRLKRKKASALAADLAPLEDILQEVKETEIEPVEEAKAQEQVPQLLKEKSGTKQTKNQRKRLLMQEKQRLDALMKVPGYKADPFKAIQDHIQNTLRSGDTGEKA